MLLKGKLHKIKTYIADLKFNKDKRFTNRINIQIAISSPRYLNIKKEEEILLIWEMAAGYAY